MGTDWKKRGKSRQTHTTRERRPTSRHAQLPSSLNTPKLHLSRSSSLNTATRRGFFLGLAFTPITCYASPLSSKGRHSCGYRLTEKERVEVKNAKRIVRLGWRSILASHFSPEK